MPREHVTRNEAIVLDKMVEEMRDYRIAADSCDTDSMKDCVERIILLLDCIVDFRNPPTSEPIESGCGKLVNSDE